MDKYVYLIYGITLLDPEIAREKVIQFMDDSGFTIMVFHRSVQLVKAQDPEFHKYFDDRYAEQIKQLLERRSV